MRLIDGDVLKNWFQSLAYDDWNQGVSTSWADAYRECADIVEDMPTIESERKKGEWKLAEDGWYCSACELYPPFDCDPEEKGISYCPYCGADMSGDDNG